MKAFLNRVGWGEASLIDMAGDASTRQYKRLNRHGETAVLMIDPDGDIDLFARLAQHLLSLGLSAPRVFAQAPGFLLLEDLGDGLVARLCDKPDQEGPLYTAAVDALLELHKHPAPADLPVADAETLAQMTDLAFDCYAGGGFDRAKAKTITTFTPILAQYGAPQGIMILRDYHAENILWLPDRIGPARAGLLDFQDALLGHRAYDLVSLIKDARRDVSPETAEACIKHYLSQSGLDETGFRTSLAVLGAQRNLRILGVFARLASLRGKPHYIDLIPRVWAHLQDDLKHPILTPVKDILDATLPEPTPTYLAKLKSTCPVP